MSGGEALLRPRLVEDIAERTRAVGSRSVLLSGMFFARGLRVAPAIAAAIHAVDHFSASLDVFHEREVPRQNVFRVLDTFVSAGKDVSLHLTGRNSRDPYIAEVVAEVRRVFQDRVPMLVNAVNSVGRAADWADAFSPPPFTGEIDPCSLAAWPVVSYDGTIVACGNDSVVDGPAPAHLCLGHADSDDWQTVRARCVTSHMLRAVRLFGPEHLASEFGEGAVTCDGYCSTCAQLSDDPGFGERVDIVMSKGSVRALEQQVTALQRRVGAVSFVRRYGLPRYAHLVALGAQA